MPLQKFRMTNMSWILLTWLIINDGFQMAENWNVYLMKVTNKYDPFSREVGTGKSL